MNIVLIVIIIQLMYTKYGDSLSIAIPVCHCVVKISFLLKILLLFSTFSFSLIFCVYFLRSKSKSFQQLFSVHQFVVNLITKTNFLKAFQLYVINPN